MQLQKLKLKKIFVQFFLVYLFFSTSTYAQNNSYIPPQVTISTGSISSNYAEGADTKTATDGTTSTTKTTPYAGTASSLPLDVSYEYFTKLNRSYFIRASGPLMASSPDRYYSGNGGMNFYFGQIGSSAMITDFNLKMKLIPKRRYYAGFAVGGGYLVYNTKSATKSDILFNLGGQGGILYSINPKWAIRGEVGAARGIGVLVSSMIINILLGVTFNLGN